MITEDSVQVECLDQIPVINNNDNDNTKSIKRKRHHDVIHSQESSDMETLVYSKDDDVRRKMKRLSKRSERVTDWKADLPTADRALYIRKRDGQLMITRRGVKVDVPACKDCFLLPYVISVPASAIGGHKCEAKIGRTLAGWFDKEKLKCFLEGDPRNGYKFPYEIIRSSKTKIWFQCDKCPHKFCSSPNHVTRSKNPTWCPYCVGRKLCGEKMCHHCNDRSLSGWNVKDKLKCFLEGDPRNGGKLSHQIALSSNTKLWFKCDSCPHEFCSNPNHVTNSKSPRWCPYCAVPVKKLCGDKTCEHCTERSLSGWRNHDRLKCFLEGDPLNGGKLSHQITLSSNKKYWFKCDKCPHEFFSALHTVTNSKRPSWCPYCVGQKLCRDKTCIHCNQRSLAGWNNKERLKCFLEGDLLNRGKFSHQIALSSNKHYWFKCDKCPHEFNSSICNVTKLNRPTWCPYCANQKVCGKDECSHCLPCCIICKLTGILCRGTYKTPDGSMCRPCYLASGHATTSRAKVSLEILMFAELQRVAMSGDGDWLWSEPTAWDCAILPGLSFKPDNIWAFDLNGNVFNNAGTCKLNVGDLGRIIVLEVLEHGIQQHSDARDVSDVDREKQIRSVFEPSGVIVQFLYVTVAHYKHPTAANTDRFFCKKPDSNEYSVVPERLNAWRERVTDVIKTLNVFLESSEGSTVFIGK